MIEINLLPEELRNKAVKIKSSEPGKAKGQFLSPRRLVLIAAAIFILLICGQLLIAVLNLAKVGQLRSLKLKWQGLEQDKKALDDFNSKYAASSEDEQTIQQLTRERVLWSEKLNKLSLDLPSGVWFNSLSTTAKELVLRGSVISMSKEELTLIRQLTDSLKNDPDFFKDFSTLEMSSAEKRKAGSYDVTDFTLNASLKAK